MNMSRLSEGYPAAEFLQQRTGILSSLYSRKPTATHAFGQFRGGALLEADEFPEGIRVM